MTSATSATITRDKFDELTKTFDAAVAAYDSITIEGEDLDFQRYLTMADTMLINFKGKKDELTMALKGAEEAVRLFKIQEKSAVKKDTQMGTLNDEMVKFKEYMRRVDEKLKTIQGLMGGADADLVKLKEAQTAGMAAFGEYDRLKAAATSAAVGDAPAHDAATAAVPDSTEIIDAKKAADEAFRTVNELNASIIKKYVDATGVAGDVIKDANFSFIKELKSSTIKAEAQTAVDELEAKRKVSYKISNIDELKNKSGELVPLLKAMKKCETDIGPITKEVETKNKEVASKIDAQAKASTITDINADIKTLVGAGTALVVQVTKLKGETDAKLQEITNLDTKIQELYKELASGSTEATEIASTVGKSADSLTEAKAVKDRIDTAATVAGETQKIIEEMGKLHAEIYAEYTKATDLVKSYDLDTKLAEQTSSRLETKTTVESNVIKAEAAYKVIMNFAKGAVLDVTEMASIQQKYTEVTSCEEPITSAQLGFSGKSTTFNISVNTEFLGKLNEALSSVNDTMKLISKMNPSYPSLGAYVMKVFSELKPIIVANTQKVTDNGNKSDALVAEIKKSIERVSKVIDDAKDHINLLKISHKKDTCEYNGNRLIFDKNKLSGGDITFEGDDRIATQPKQQKKCLWLTTTPGIPTDCPDPVEWKIKISRTNKNSGTDLPELTMGIGLDSFNPITSASGDDCKPTKGFWGFSGTSSFSNETETTHPLSLSIFKSDDEVTFTLKPDTTTATGKHKLILTISPPGGVPISIAIEVDIGVDFLYPIVRFKSEGDKYEIIHDAGILAGSPAGMAAAATATAAATAAAEAQTAAATAAAEAQTAAAAAAAFASDEADSIHDDAAAAKNQLVAYIPKISSNITPSKDVLDSITVLTSAYTKFEGIDKQFKPNLKVKAKSIAQSIITGADTTFKILQKVSEFADTDLSKAIIDTSPVPPPPPPSSQSPPVITEVMFYEITQKLEFMTIVGNNYTRRIGPHVTRISSANKASSSMFSNTPKFDLENIKAFLIANTDKFTDPGVTFSIKNYAQDQILELNKKIDAIGDLDKTNKDFRYDDPAPNMVLAYLTNQILELNKTANQYMFSSLPSIKKNVDDARSVLVKDILATFVPLIALATSATVTTTQKSDMLTYANSIKLKRNDFNAHVKEAYENARLPLLLKLAAASTSASLAAATAATARVDAIYAPAEAAAAMAAARIAAAAATTSLTRTKEAKESIDNFSSYFTFISEVTNGVDPLVDDINKMFYGSNVGTFFAGGGRGRRHGHARGGKSFMTRRNRLKLKKSRIITRRHKSSRLSRTSHAQLSTRNKGGKGVKASTTRKLNGGVTV